MGLLSDLKDEVEGIFRERWAVVDARVVPKPGRFKAFQ